MFLQENAFENVVCKMLAKYVSALICSIRPQDNSPSMSVPMGIVHSYHVDKKALHNVVEHVD